MSRWNATNKDLFYYNQEILGHLSGHLGPSIASPLSTIRLKQPTVRRLINEISVLQTHFQSCVIGHSQSLPRTFTTRLSLPEFRRCCSTSRPGPRPGGAQSLWVCSVNAEDAFSVKIKVNDELLDVQYGPGKPGNKQETRGQFHHHNDRSYERLGSHRMGQAA